jgi:hypothetical protein
LLMPCYTKCRLFCKAFFSFNYDFCRFACSMAAIAQASGAPWYTPSFHRFRISASVSLSSS